MRDCRPFDVALRGEASNHLMLRWRLVAVVSDEETAHVMRQVGTGKASGGEPLTTCRDQYLASKPVQPSSTGMSLADVPLTGQVVPGMKAARARSAASTWNVGRQVPIRSACVERRGSARGSAPSSGICEVLSTDAAPVGGPACSSGEASVMDVEPRGRVIGGLLVRATGTGVVLGGPG